MKGKRLYLFVLGLLLALSSIAAGKKTAAPVTMVSYEQRWLDYEGTLALRNNTDKEICKVVYQLVYLNMKGEQLDYKEYTSNVDILPGMTKKVIVEAYEHRRNYHYYKTPDNSGYPTFKVKFQLKKYSVRDVDEALKDKAGSDISSDDEAMEEEEDSDTGFDNNVMVGIAAIAMVLIVLGIWIGVYVLVAVMAKNRNRNVVIWVLLSLLATPLLMAIILLCIGNADVDEEEE